MTIKVTNGAEETTLALEGRIDTNTAPKLQSEILKAFQTSRRVVVDFKQVPYISSAGLRALLIGHKTAASKGGALVLVQVSEMVKGILDSVGFSQILNIQ